MDIKLAERIRAVRERAGLNKKEFARELGVSPAYVTMLEKGCKSNGSPIHPSKKFLSLLALKFGIDVVWMKTGVGASSRTDREALIQKIWMLLDEDVARAKEVIDVLDRHSRVG